MRGRNRDTKRRLRIRWQTFCKAPLGQGRVVHILHIGKTAGTALKQALDAAKGRDAPTILDHKHGVRLTHLPRGATYVFAVRDPITRFYSGFYSRKRRGRPVRDVPWSAAEETAFNTFPEATELAEALDSDDDPTRLAAQSAMRGIEHVRDPHLKWFDHDPETVFASCPPLMILRQSHLEADLAILGERLGLNLADAMPTDPVKAHRNDYSATPPLSPRARRNLEDWYAADIDFVRRAEAWADAAAKGAYR